MVNIFRLLCFLFFFQSLVACSPIPQKEQDEFKPFPVPEFPAPLSCAPRSKIKADPVPWRPYKAELIVIDPGHGGHDFGTHSRSNPKYHEKSLNLSTARLLRDYLKQLGYKAVMTRSEDLFISLENRSAFTNNKKPALFVSVHYNSAPSVKAEGIEIFYYESEKDKKRSAESKKLANCILAKIIESSKAKSRGVKHGNLAVIRETTVPAVLIEAGFLTNEEEMEKIKDPAYLKKIAWGIAEGIENYLTQRCKTGT